MVNQAGEKGGEGSGENSMGGSEGATQAGGVGGKQPAGKRRTVF